MKFLHLSDLHIGKSVNGFSMLGEQKHAFGQILGYIRTMETAAVIIAGDVYDRALPGAEAVQVFDDLLTALAGEGVTVLLISGNHDSPERLGYASRLLAEKKLFLRGVFGGTLDKIVLTDEYGEINFWLLPFIRPTSMEEAENSYYEALAAILKTADIDFSARNVLVSHQFYTKAGVAPLRSESEMSPVGGLDGIDAGLIEGFDYIALGHLHRAQSVGSKHIRYCGSTVKYSFSEWRQAKTVTLVELKAKGELTITALPITPIHDMREIKGGIEKLTSSDIASLADREDYLRVILTDEEEIIDPMNKLRSVYPNIMSLDFDNTRRGVDISTIKTELETLERLSPYDLFREFFLEVQGAVMNEAQAEIAAKLMEEEIEI